MIKGQLRSSGLLSRQVISYHDTDIDSCVGFKELVLLLWLNMELERPGSDLISAITITMGKDESLQFLGSFYDVDFIPEEDVGLSEGLLDGFSALVLSVSSVEFELSFEDG